MDKVVVLENNHPEMEAVPESTAIVEKDKLRGKGYSAVEDLLACKAFIAASEDPLKGTSQKGKAFKLTMHNAYKLLLKEQAKVDKQQWSSATTSDRALLIEPTIYDERTPDSLYTRYKDQIALRVNKFLGIEEVTQQDSGSDSEQFYQKCKKVWDKRYASLGPFDPFRLCKDYLVTKPKFHTFRQVMLDEEAGKNKKERPVGKKREAEKEESKKLITSALKEAGCIAADEKPPGDGAGGAIDRVVTVIASLGQTVMEHWQKEADEKFLESMPTPDKKNIKSEMAQIRLLEARQKRRKMELEAMEEENKLLQMKEKLTQQRLALEKEAAPAEEVEVSLSRTSHSVSSLGQDECRLDTATSSTRPDCCAGEEYCSFVTEEITEYDRDSIFPELRCVKCNGLAHHLCIKLIVGDLNICFKCYYAEAARSGRSKKD